MDKQFVHAAHGRGCEKFSGSGYKYVLTDRNWNDLGYYTLHELFLITPNGVDNVKLADIKLFNHDQKKDEHPNLTTSNFVGFITGIEWAERILLFLSPDERKELLSSLHIKFDCKLYKDQQALLKSVLRNLTFEQFEERQSKIKSIISIQEDIASMIDRNKEILKLK